MAPSTQAHRRSHSLLLFQKLLNLRDSASPLTLVLDTLEQSASPIIHEFIARARLSPHTKIIFISFATIKQPNNVDIFIKARGKSLQKLRSEIVCHYPAPTNPTRKDGPGTQKILLLIDSLNPLSATQPQHLTPFLTSLLTHPTISLVATFHADVPLPLPASALGEYEPHPLAVLQHLATAVLRVSSLHQAVEKRRAQNRSLPEPVFGLNERREGVLVGLVGKMSSAAAAAVVAEMELRRRSGRAVVERFVVPVGAAGGAGGGGGGGGLSLLSDHPLFAVPEDGDRGAAGRTGPDDEELAETTFSLGLTDKQRRDREGVVLPYFDAQEDVGGGEGGRILYEMGREDDFDDEEDEI